jgi:hypothetical protein
LPSIIVSEERRRNSRHLVREISPTPIADKYRIVDVRQIDHDVVWGATRQPKQFFGGAHVDLDVRHVRRNKYEIASVMSMNSE